MGHFARVSKRALTFLRTNKRLLTCVGMFGVGFAICIWLLEHNASPWLVINAEAALQFIGGNWPTQADNHTTFAFALGPAFRTILLIGAVSGVWTGIIRIGDVLIMQKMKLTDFLADRDRERETPVP